MIQDKKILVSGGAGSIGSELVRQLAVNNSVHIVDTNETNLFDLLEELRNPKVRGQIGDVRDWDMFEQLECPDIIFHVAALKHVTPSAWTPSEYVKTNILGTLNVIRFAKLFKAKLVNISTDKVVHANSIMGATKKVAEIAVRDAGGISVRFGNVLNSRGSLLPFWQGQIDRGEPITVTDVRMERYFMSIPEAVSLVIQATEIGEAGDVIVLDMGKPIKIIDLAHEIINKLGRDIPIKMIGLRKGETLSEELMTESEKKTAIKKDNFYIINDKNMSKL